MIIEMRTYKIKPGKRTEFLEQKLMPILEKYDVVVVEAKEGLGDWR
jgi:hypothetical protein